MTERQVRRRKQLLDDIKDRRVYWNLKEEALCGELAVEDAMDM